MDKHNQPDQAIYIASLVAGYLKGELDDTQLNELSDWINEDQQHRLQFEMLCHEANLTDAYALFNLFDTEAALMKVKRSEDFIPEQRRRIWPRIAIAAAVAAVLFSAGLFFFQPRPAKTIIQTNDVAPGKQSATLTLGNGKKINLSDAANGELAKEAGVRITKSADGELIYELQGNSDVHTINSISTAKGETYQVRLPDGSSVWLNAASRITYATNMQHESERRIRLEGEGYFEVAKDMERPFIVSTGDQEVEVLGTHFNINSYTDEEAVKTTLMEGSIKVRATGGQQVLKPGQQATNKDGRLSIKTVEADHVIDWKNDEFLLDNQDLRSSLRKIARWYDLEVIYGAGVPLDVEIGGGISRNSNLSSVLKLIESTGLVHFKIAGRKLYVNQ